MGNICSYAHQLATYYILHRNLLPLTEDQREALLEIQERAENRCYLYGQKNQAEKPCKRLKIGPKWTQRPRRNNITPHPKELKIPHATYMLEHNIQLPPASQSGVCHRCVDPNWKGESRKYTGAPCFEPAHLILGPHGMNKDMRICQNVINDFARDCGNNPDYRTTGIIYLKDVPRSARPDKHKDRVCNHGCFAIYGKSK